MLRNEFNDPSVIDRLIKRKVKKVIKRPENFINTHSALIVR